MSTERPLQSDKELWQSLATGREVAGPVSDMDLAAWLEGRLPETAAARIDAAMAADPELRRTALELSAVLGQPLPVPPPRLEVRAKALVGFEVERPVRRSSLLDWLFASDRRYVMQRAGAVAAALVIAVSGFVLGGGLGNSLAQEHQRYASAANPTTDSSGEASDFLGSDSI